MKAQTPAPIQTFDDPIDFDALLAQTAPRLEGALIVAHVREAGGQVTLEGGRVVLDSSGTEGQEVEFAFLVADNDAEVRAALMREVPDLD